MHQNNTLVSQQKWYDSAHASLCILGRYLRQIGFFEPVERRVHLQQKVLKYTAVHKLEMLFVGLLTGIKAVSHTATTVRVDVALTTAFGLPGCADQSVIADTLDAATEADVADLGAAIAELFGRYSQARQQDARERDVGARCGSVALTCKQGRGRVGTRLYGPVSLENGAQVSAGTSSRDR